MIEFDAARGDRAMLIRENFEDRFIVVGSPNHSQIDINC